MYKVSTSVSKIFNNESKIPIQIKIEMVHKKISRGADSFFLRRRLPDKTNILLTGTTSIYLTNTVVWMAVVLS
jgi:hypothetical protein